MEYYSLLKKLKSQWKSMKITIQTSIRMQIENDNKEVMLFVINIWYVFPLNM